MAIEQPACNSGAPAEEYKGTVCIYVDCYWSVVTLQALAGNVELDSGQLALSYTKT